VRGRSRTDWWGVVLDTPDPRALAGFYSKLLGWPIADDGPDWVSMAQPNGVAYLAFQPSPEYVRPTWPPVDGRQQMMLHLDVAVDDLEDAVAAALELGATLAEFQPQERVRVLLDPDGHPFCLYLDPDVGD
jgi:catechol 2,3-dioxygenase-like lactoylglutathione lyase family enzyme